MKLRLLLLLSLCRAWPLTPATASDSSATPPGLTASDWGGIRAEYDRCRHAAVPSLDGQTMRNPGQQWTTHSDARGFLVTPDAGGWTWGLALQSYGFAGAEGTPLLPPVVSVDGPRVTYDHDGNLQEWLLNDTRGLEHGFTVQQRPGPVADLKSQIINPLCVTLAIRGPLRPVVSADAVQFKDQAGATVLTYAGLKAWDADHRPLPAHMEPADGALRLVVDERGARYPLTIDPIAQQAYLKASNTGAGDLFGYAVAIAGDTVVVGATIEDSTALNSGAAFVFTRTGTTWTQQAVLKAGNAVANGQFGWSVAISGNTVVVGTPWEDTTAADSGAAYVFVRSGTVWNQQAMLKASNADPGDGFGAAVAISTDTVVVGAPQEASAGQNQSDNSAGQAGAAYVFTRSGTAWSQQAYLKASNVERGDSFGWSVAVSGDSIAVGAPSEDSSALGVNKDQLNNNAVDSGAVYILTRSGGAWSQQAYLKASNTGEDDRFGYAVAMSGNTIVTSARWEGSAFRADQSDDSLRQAGAAYVFVRSAADWSQEAYLKAEQPDNDDQFGQSVAISGDVIAVGSRGEASGATGINGNQADETAPSAGAVYVFERASGTWSLSAYLKASNTGAGDNFGWAVGVAGNTVISGAWLEDSSATGVNGLANDEAATNAGAAYVFLRTGTTWAQQAFLKTSNSAAGDQFGYSVSLSGDIAVVGAPFEDSSATGVNGNQADNGASNSGAAYVFVRNGVHWTQQAYLKASNTEAADNFGGAVGVSSTFIVVGATEEDGNAPGVNDPTGQASNLASNSGAAYIFERSGGVWTQTAYVKASNPGNLDRFGGSVAVSGGTVVVGATDEDSTATGVNGLQNNNNAPGSGAAYVFVRDQSSGVWSQQAYLKAFNISGNNADDRFGTSVAVRDHTIVVGAEREDGMALLSGAAYVFARSGTIWTPDGYLKAANAGSEDAFGWSVAATDFRIIVGAPKEDSAATGVGNNGNDESASDSGAAYAYRRNGTAWVQEAYLKAHNTGAGDAFGWSVAADTLDTYNAVVGARYEGSNATGRNGDGGNNSAPTAGAVYFFRSDGGAWYQDSYLKASNTGSGDNLGASVSISGATVLAGAPGEDSSARGVNGSQDNNLALDSGAAYVFDPEVLTCVEQWRQAAFGNPTGAGDEADLADKDRDGQVNLLELATGQNPLGTTPRPFALTKNGANLEFTWPGAKCPDGSVTWTVEWSDNLAAWSTAGVASFVLSDNGTVRQWLSTIPAGTGGERYVRLRVTVF